jgi:MHS family proline/betaine transporter-like MFS transporter
MSGMIIPSLLIGILPSYATIGLAAPIILILIRVIQGISLGGEAGGIYSYLAEKANETNKSVYCSIGLIGNALGFILGNALVMLIRFFLSDQAFNDWGWRLPFLISLLFGLVAVYLRTSMDETIVYPNRQESSKKQRTPLKELFIDYKKNIFFGILMYAPAVSAFYMTTIFLNGYMTELHHHPATEFAEMMFIAMTLYIFVLPFCAHCADKIGFKKYTVTSLSLLILLIYPAFYLAESKFFSLRLLSVSSLALLSALYTAPMPAFLTSLFPTRVRYTGVSLTLNVSCALFGGLTPYVSELLIHATGFEGAVAVYIIFISILAIILLRSFIYSMHDQIVY